MTIARTGLKVKGQANAVGPTLIDGSFSSRRAPNVATSWHGHFMEWVQGLSAERDEFSGQSRRGRADIHAADQNT